MPRPPLAAVPEPVATSVDPKGATKPPLKQDTSVAPSIIVEGATRKPLFNPDEPAEETTAEVKPKRRGKTKETSEPVTEPEQQ